MLDVRDAVEPTTLQEQGTLERERAGQTATRQRSPLRVEGRIGVIISEHRWVLERMSEPYRASIDRARVYPTDPGGERNKLTATISACAPDGLAAAAGLCPCGLAVALLLFSRGLDMVSSCRGYCFSLASFLGIVRRRGEKGGEVREGSAVEEILHAAILRALRCMALPNGGRGGSHPIKLMGLGLLGVGFFKHGILQARTLGVRAIRVWKLIGGSGDQETGPGGHSRFPRPQPEQGGIAFEDEVG